MKNDKKDRIFKAVIELIHTDGIAGLSMSKIAKKANISIATTYLYFKNKEDMLGQLYLMLKEKMNQYMLKQIPKTGSSEEKAAAFMRSFYTFSLEHKEYMDVIQQFRNSLMLELLGLEQDKIIDDFSKPWIAIFVEGVENGTFRQMDPIGMSYFCYFTAIGYVVSGGEKESTTHNLAFEDLINLTLHAIKENNA